MGDQPVLEEIGSITANLPAGNERMAISSIINTNFQPRKLISHIFREADGRPPQTVSYLFTGLTLAPFLLLLILWMSFGVNFQRFRVTELSALVFHSSLGGILVLFVYYWLQLNMFQ